MELPEPAADLVLAATYERRVNASVERVWENVLDWEHLPWLHASAFESIESVDAGEWGWRGMLAGAGSTAPSQVELMVDRDAGRYVVRTGPPPAAREAGAPDAGRPGEAGPRSEIWTHLEPVSTEATVVRVEFRLPHLPDEQLRAIGLVYVDVYTRLWDEDEEMICERALRLREIESARPAEAIDLGTPDELREKLPLEVEFAGRPHRVVELDGRLIAYSTACPHMLGPLFAADGEEAIVECPWHGYAFDLRTGRSCDGRGLRLSPAPQVVVDERTGRCALVPARARAPLPGSAVR